MRKKSRFFCINHQGKANPYLAALRARGYRQTAMLDRASFALLDHDLGGRATTINKLRVPVFLYPHTARPFLQYDGMYPPHENVTAMFTIARGQQQITSMFTNRPVHPVGWALCKQSYFRHCLFPRKILFAPIHVNGNGFLSEREQNTNRRAFLALLKVKQEHGLELRVRYLHDLHRSGLTWHEEGVEYIKGEADQSHAEIDWADVVVAHQTMAYIAIARGAPTLMMDEDLPPMSGNAPNNIRLVKNWDKYKHLLMYPRDILSSEKTMNLIVEAARGNDAATWAWRDRFIGAPFNGDLFVDILESYLE